MLYDDAPTVDYKAVEKIFLEEFGKKPSDIFSEFDPVAIASASIAQVLSVPSFLHLRPLISRLQTY